MPNVTAVDDAWVAAMRSGDQSALGHIVDKYTAYVGTIVWNIVRDKLSKADAEEIISDVFIALWSNVDKVREGKLKGYLSSVARRRALNALRRPKPETYFDDDVIHIPIEGPEDESIRQEEYAALVQTVGDLPEPDRTIFIRHYFLCQKAAEIAKTSGINVNTVKSKLRRGRERLRQELTEGGYFIG